MKGAFITRSFRRFIIVILIGVALLPGCSTDESQLVWNHQMVSVCDAIHTAGREREIGLFGEGQIQLLLGRPDVVGDAVNSMIFDDTLRRAAAASLAQYQGHEYERPAQAGVVLTKEESEALRASSLWLYEEEKHYTRPLPGCSFARYLVVFQGGKAVNSAIVPKE
jgi:hypothetical protein